MWFTVAHIMEPRFASQQKFSRKQQLKPSQLVFLTFNTTMTVLMTVAFLEFWRSMEFVIWVLVALVYGLGSIFVLPRRTGDILFRIILLIGLIIFYRTLIPEPVFAL
jgi:hypothetical protein